jgi:hypothetical protein
MLNTNNKAIARAIGAAYCGTNTVCAESLFNRLNTYFDDETFISFLSTLQSRAYLVGGFQNLGYLPGGLVKIKFVYFDIISGANGEGLKILPNAFFVENNIDKIIKVFDASLFFVKQNSDNSTLFYNSSQGYNIAYIQTPSSGGNTGNTGNTGTGNIVVPDLTTPGNVNAIQTPIASSGFDYQSLIIPGAVLAGLYLLMKK